MSLRTTHITTKNPEISSQQLIEELVPPAQFDNARFDSYIPDPQEPSQQQVRDQMKDFVSQINKYSGKKTGSKKSSGSFLGKFFGPKNLELSKKASPKSVKQGLYLDGGFGVGKTHLLAAAWHETKGKKAFGTFVEYTQLVGALGFNEALTALIDYDLICIDEFELDDPGDTVLMSRLMRELSDAGVYLIASSNTLPDALGEGRFAAEDFKREIQMLADQFEALRIDGRDYRQRDLEKSLDPMTNENINNVLEYFDSLDTVVTVARDRYGDIIDHLQNIHPSKYGHLVNDIDVLVIDDLDTVVEQNLGLRLVVLIDRLYDNSVPVIYSVTEDTNKSLDQIFTDEMLASGYKKKYLRAMSRINALSAEGQKLASS